MSRGNPGARAVLNALEHLADEYAAECDRIRQNIAITQGQLRDYQARIGQPFTHDAYLTELTALRDQLRDGLSGKTPGAGEATSVAKLVEQIKSVRTANNIQSTPQHTRQSQSTAEESVVTRIHRRAASKPDVEALSPPEASIGLPVSPSMTFQQRVDFARHAPPTTGSSHARDV
jgi:hypothetical protein